MSSTYSPNPDPLQDSPRSTPVLSWFNLILVAAFFIVSLVYYPPLTDASKSLESPQWVKFFGRFHFIALHLPVGVVFLALFMDIASWFSKKSAVFLKPAITFALSVSAWGSVIAVVFGIFLARKGNLNTAEFYAHQALGIVMTVGLLVSLFFKIIEDQTGKGTSLYRIALFASVAIMGLGAHFGGNMVHGSDYLTKYAPNEAGKLVEEFEARILAFFAPADKKTEGGTASKNQPVDPVAKAPKPAPGATANTNPTPPPVTPAGQKPAPAPVNAAILAAAKPTNDKKQASVYTALIAPFLEAKCNECHNEDKVKGDLRLDSYEMIVKGGANGDTLIPKDPDASALIYTMEAPLDADEHMPPEKKPQPSKEEIALLRWWVLEGASKELKVAEAKFPAELVSFVDAQLAGATTGTSGGGLSFVALSAQQVAAAAGPAQKVIDDIAKTGASLAPVSVNAKELRFTAINVGKGFKDEHVKLLEPVANEVVELNLGKTSVTDQVGASLGKFSNLKVLHLENTQVSDAILPELKKLAKLEYLNLYHTKISDRVFEALPALKNLKSLYLWETQVTKDAALKYVDNHPQLVINLGWDTSVKSDKPAPAPAPAAPPAPAPAANTPVLTQITPESKIYESIVAPIMAAKCVSCHGEERTKGRLKLHTFADIMKGGSDGDNTVIPGEIVNSLLLARIHLPEDDDEHMPPAKEPQVTKAELALLTWWVQHGAKEDMTVAQAPKNAEIEDALKAFPQNLPKAPVQAATAAPKAKPLTEEEKKAVVEVRKKLEPIRATLLPVALDREQLRLSVINGASSFGDQQALLLEPIAPIIIWADFARSKVTDQVGATLSKFVNLERLHLENTVVTDAVIDSLLKLQKLEYLNLYGTQVSDAQIEKLAALKGLKNLYLWQTKVTRPVAKKLEAQVPGLKVNIGLSEEELETLVKPAEAAKPVVAPPPAPAKPAAPAPAKPAAPAPAKPAAPAPAKPVAPAPAKPATPAPAKPATPAPAKPATPAVQ